MLAHFVSILLLQSIFALSVQASLYVIQPRSGFACSGGKPCTVEWLDDGLSPLLSQIGATYIALYNGDNVLVQQIEPVDLSLVHSLQFTPDPKAGPSSDR
ncbi:hypothetical protein C8Q78DRAFT_970980 [Trametes maxima]|nr:hypothetical protein C8Q78DRAFT_970980 [Trametes maxima]